MAKAAAGLGTVDVDCPRPGCTDKVQCTLQSEPVKPKPGAKVATVKVTVPDLADRMADHYRDHHPAEFAEATAS